MFLKFITYSLYKATMRLCFVTIFFKEAIFVKKKTDYFISMPPRFFLLMFKAIFSYFVELYNPSHLATTVLDFVYMPVNMYRLYQNLPVSRTKCIVAPHSIKAKKLLHPFLVHCIVRRPSKGR